MKVRKWLCAVLAVVLVLGLYGCGAASKATDSAAAENGYYAESADEVLYSDTEMDGSAALPESRKWIITVDMDVETEDLDALLSALGEQIEAMEGYVEAQRVYNGSSYSSRRYRSASMTVRIPADRVDSFTEQVAGVSNVVSRNKDLQDVTLSYTATESRMNALQAEEARLLELMAQAEDMSDLLEIESRLTDVRYELESVTSQLRLYDNQVDYATIYLSIDEVQEYTVVEEETLWQRISGGFVSSLKGVGNFFVELFVWLVTKLPYIVVFGVLGAGVVVLVRKVVKKKKKAE